MGGRSSHGARGRGADEVFATTPALVLVIPVSLAELRRVNLSQIAEVSTVVVPTIIVIVEPPVIVITIAAFVVAVFVPDLGPPRRWVLQLGARPVRGAGHRVRAGADGGPHDDRRHQQCHRHHAACSTEPSADAHVPTPSG
jgi:hypothetical protein